MRVLIVDDHEVVRRGVRSLILSDSKYEICGEAVDGQDAVEKATLLSPDVIVMDVSMPRLNGLEATPLIRTALPDCEILILSQHDSAEMIRQASKAGARGYVVKSSIARDLLTALESVSRHQPFFDAVSPPVKLTPMDSKEILQRSETFEQALRESEELYRSTFELTAIGIAHVNSSGRFLRLNEKFVQIAGYSKDELLRMTFHDLTHPEDLEADLAHAEKIKSGALDHYSTDKRYIRKDGSEVWIKLTVSAVRDTSGNLKHFITVIEDINRRRQGEEALFKLAAIVESSDDAVISKDLNGTIMSWNTGAARIFGYTAQEAIGQPITLIIPPELQGEEKEIISRLRNGQRIDHFETVRQTKTGGRLAISLTVSPVIDGNGKVIGASKIARDITEQKELRERLEARVKQRTEELEEKNKALIEQTETVRELSGRLLRIQDEERRRIARDLHDSAGQILVALQMNLAPLRTAAQCDSEFEKGIVESLGLVDQLSKELRTLSYLLHPPLLDEAGLSSALQWYVEGFTQRSTIDVKLDVAPEIGRLPGDMEMTIFRIVQESLTNIHRHSGSDQARISVLRDAEEICLQIQDNGRGMPASKNGRSPARARTGVGIQGMRERVKQLGGRFEIHSNGNGTEVMAAFPSVVAEMDAESLSSK
jgi:PAS domain S-box-containing protein